MRSTSEIQPKVPARNAARRASSDDLRDSNTLSVKEIASDTTLLALDAALGVARAAEARGGFAEGAAKLLLLSNQMKKAAAALARHIDDCDSAGSG